MKNLHKSMCALTLSLLSLTAIAKTIETNEIQILINQAAPTNEFAANIGGSITNDPMAVLPAGTTLIQNGLIFPKGTIGLSQDSYLEDKHGTLLTESNSIGEWQSTNFELVEFDPNNPPAVGTTFNQTMNTFTFKPTSTNSPNLIFTMGNQTLVNAPQDGAQLSIIPMAVLGGSGKNENASNNATAKVYVAPDGLSLLMVVKFDKKIKVNV